MPQQSSTEQTLRAENAELRMRLEKSEQNRLRGELLEQVRDAVIAVDTEERITFLNGAAERKYVVHAGDVLGRKITEIYTRHWPESEGEAADWATFRESGVWFSEAFHRTHDGRELYVESRVTALRDVDGVTTGRLAVIRDITKRHQAEAMLRRNTALFAEIIEQAPGGVYVVDAQFRVAQMNAKSLRYFESVQPLIGRDFGEVLEILWGPEIGPPLASIFRHTLATGERYVSPRFSELRHDIGVQQAFEWETQRITLPDGLHGVVCYFRDVTARERAEAALRLTSERLTLAVKCSQVVLFQQDLELRYLWLQNAAPGFEGFDAIGKRDADLMERAADAAVIEALKREVIRSGVSVRQEVLVHIQGAGRHYDLLVDPQRDAAGQISGVTGAATDITERKRAEEARFESERHFRALVTASSAVVYRMSADWSEMHQLHGKDFIVNTTTPRVRWVEEYLFPEDKPQVLAAIREAIRTKSPFEMEHRVRRVDGSAGWTYSHAVPLLDAKGEIAEWFGAAHDVTARRQAEEERRLLASIVANSRDFIGISDTHGNPVYGNRAAMELVGVQDLEQVRRSKIIDYFIPEQRLFVEEVVMHAAATDGRWSGELTMQHFVTGARFPVWYDLFRVDDPVTGQPVNFATITRDLTESKRVAQALADRTELLNGVLQGTSDVIYVKDTNGRILLANAAFGAAARTTPEQLVGKTAEDLFPPDEAALIQQSDVAVIAGGAPIQIEETILEAGEPRVFLSLKAPLRDGSGRVIGLFGISRDITERKRIELSLTHAVAAAEKANRAKSDFLSNMSHELRTPLNAILGFAQLMVSSTPAPTPAQKRSLDQIIKGGWYLLDLINELLNLALIESGNLSLTLEPVSLAEIILTCQAMVEPQARERGIELTFPSFELAEYVHADRTRLQQVVINLLSNAIKYNKAQGAVIVECTLSSPDAIRITVRDTGEGLTAEKLAQLFQPFNRLGQEAGPQTGTGIGLVMTKRLVELMGGAIGAQSVVGVGSVFWFELKRASATQFALLQSEAPSQGVPTGTTQGTLHRF